MNREQAEDVAIKALGWLASTPDKLQHFCNTTGASADDIRVRANEPEFLGFVLDFLLLDDSTILSFAEDAGIPPESIRSAQVSLAGEAPQWA